MPLKHLIAQCINRILNFIEHSDSNLTNRELLEICGPVGEFQKGTMNPHFPHEIAETAINLLIKQILAAKLLFADDPLTAYCLLLKPIIKRMPTQTWRSSEQNLWQQFSTPPGIAFFLLYLLNLIGNESAFEPSAGTGSLAVWSTGIGARTNVNEIDSRRRTLLKYLGYTPTAHNGEFIHDLLPSEYKTDSLIMNPPFSSNGGRTKSNSSKFGFRHVASALERLQPGGKFGIILGNAAGLDTKTGLQFWQKLSGTIGIKAIIRIAGKEYVKNGTSVDVNLVIGTKYVELRDSGADLSVIQLSISDIEEGFTLAQQHNLRLD